MTEFKLVPMEPTEAVNPDFVKAVQIAAIEFFGEPI